MIGTPVFAAVAVLALSPVAHDLSTRQTLMVLAALALLGGVIGFSGHVAGITDGLMFALFAILGIVLGVLRLARAMRSADSGTKAKAVQTQRPLLISSMIKQVAFRPEQRCWGEKNLRRSFERL